MLSANNFVKSTLATDFNCSRKLRFVCVYACSGVQPFLATLELICQVARSRELLAEMLQSNPCSQSHTEHTEGHKGDRVCAAQTPLYPRKAGDGGMLDGRKESLNCQVVDKKTDVEIEGESCSTM